MSYARCCLDEGPVPFLHDDEDLPRVKRRRVKGGTGQGESLQRSALRERRRGEKKEGGTRQPRYKADEKKKKGGMGIQRRRANIRADLFIQAAIQFIQFRHNVWPTGQAAKTCIPPFSRIPDSVVMPPLTGLTSWPYVIGIACRKPSASRNTRTRCTYIGHGMLYRQSCAYASVVCLSAQALFPQPQEVRESRALCVLGCLLHRLHGWPLLVRVE
jgi:hypothetical protein